MSGNVLVIGGGIGGIQASLDLANMGIHTVLLEGAPSVGGRMAQLDKTFPTNDCSTCILSPKLLELAAHPNIEILAFTEIEALRKKGVKFEARIRKKALFVDPEKCTACGMCAEKCPVKIPDLFNKGIGNSKSIGIPYAQAIPAVYRIDKENCLYLTKGKCGVCKKVCEAGAIDYEQQDIVETSFFDSVIVAVGASEFLPEIRPEYGHGLYPNVLTSIEYERFLSASGPTGGVIKRPSDGKEPEKIAFIQCVGSRDLQAGNHGYCSSYCCMQATKAAVITREHGGNIDTTIFYIDLRAFGKDFDRYVDRAKEQYKVSYVQSRISEVTENPEDRSLKVKYITPDGTVSSEVYDMVVLSVGIQVPPKTTALLRSLGIRMDQFGFPVTNAPTVTNMEGLLVCGSITGPMDIPETVISASAAAVTASRFVRDQNNSEGESEDDDGPLDNKAGTGRAEETEIKGIPPRIGVVVCRCGHNIGSIVDVPQVVKEAEKFSHVTMAEELTYACSADSIAHIIKTITEKGLNRMVVASCSPRTHERVFRAALENAGLNKYLLQMTNIRDQCSWVHQNVPEQATWKAVDLVRMAVNKAAFLNPLYEIESDVTKAALVLGGGISGMTAALSIAERGYPVFLLEKGDTLGGNARHLLKTLDMANVPRYLEDLAGRVTGHPLVEVLTGAEVKDVKGFIGNFTAKAALGEEEREFKTGAIIVASGGVEHVPSSYGYSDLNGVVTQREFEIMLGANHPSLLKARNVVMIQCVESREGSRNYCSRICCGEAVKNSRAFKQKYPDKDIYILYRDIRTYGLLEEHYTFSREEGAVYIRYDRENKPVVEKTDGGLSVRCYDTLIQKDIILPADLVVLSSGIDASESNGSMAKMLKVPVTQDGFFAEAHVKLRPVEFSTDGIYVCGLSHGPKYLKESAASALAAAGKALLVLGSGSIRSEAVCAEVDQKKCSGCGACAANCPAQAIEIDPALGTAIVTRPLCKGCGACVATCYSGAVDISGYTNKQLLKELEGLFV